MDVITSSWTVLSRSTIISQEHLAIVCAAVFVLLILGFVLSSSLAQQKSFTESSVVAYSKFMYACILKPHRSGSTGDQQSALESFYQTQVRALTDILFYHATHTS